MAQFTDMRVSEEKNTHGEFDELLRQQRPWLRPSPPAEIHTTATQISDHQHHGEDDDDHPHKKSVLQKVKDKAKKLIKKKKKKQPDHGNDNDHRKEVEDQHHFQEEEEGEEEEDEDEEDDTEEEEERKDWCCSPWFFLVVAQSSAVSPGLDAAPARTLLDDTELASDPEAPKTGLQWPSRDPNMLAGGVNDHKAPSPAETARRQQEVPAALDQPSAGITPILQSTEAAYSSTVRDPDIGTTHTVAADSILDVPAVPTEFDALPSHNRRKEAQDNAVLNVRDEIKRLESIQLSDPSAKSPTLTEEIMKPARVEEPAMEKLIERAGEVCGFDTNKEDIVVADFGAGEPTLKDQNPNATNKDWEKSGPLKPISDEFKYTEDKLGDIEINKHSNVSDEPQDLRAQDVRSKEANENAGRSVAVEAGTSVVGSAIGVAQGLKDKIAAGLGGTGPHANENHKEEGAEHDGSYTEKIYEVTSTAKNAIASKLGYGEHHEPVDEAPNKPNRTVPYEEGKSYTDKIYDTASAAKNVISSKLGYGEHQVPVQEEAEKKTDWLSADLDEGGHEEGAKSFTDKIYYTASAANNVVSSKLGYGKQEDPVVEEKPERQMMQEKYGDGNQTKSDEHDTGEGKSYAQKIYETATTAKNAISSKIGYGGKETAQDHEQQIDKVSKDESKVPVSYSN